MAKTWVQHKSSEISGSIIKLLLEMSKEQSPTKMKVQLTTMLTLGPCSVVLAANQQPTWTILLAYDEQPQEGSEAK